MAALCAAIGYLGPDNFGPGHAPGWYLGTVFFILCMFGWGKVPEEKTPASNVNSPENIAARKAEYERVLNQRDQQQQKDREKRQTLLDEHFVWQTKQNLQWAAIRESRARRGTGFSDAEWEHVQETSQKFAEQALKEKKRREGRR